MNRLATVLLVVVMASPVLATDSASPLPPGPIAARASAEVDRLARAPERRSRDTLAPDRQPKKSGWIARHPKLFGALVGFGAGCAIGASNVGGSDDNFFNTLDEFACPVAGGLGAAAGALVGALVK